jgi:hypothetical protein
MAGGPHGPPGQHTQDCEQRGSEHTPPAGQHERIRLYATGRVELPDRAHRGQRRHRHRTRHREGRVPENGHRPGQPGRERGLRPGRAHGTQPRQVGRGPVQQLRQGLARQHEQRQRRQAAEDGQRDRLRLNPLLHLLVDDVQAADVEADRPRWRVEPPVQPAGEDGQALLERGDAGAAILEPQPYPPEREPAVEVPGGGRWGQHGVVHLVELVPEHRRNVHDPGDHERGPPGRNRRVRRVLAVERVGHVAAHADVEGPGQPGGEHDLVRGAKRGQPAGEHRHPVLAEAIPVEAAGQAVGEEGVAHLPVHDRVGVQAHGGGGGRHAGQALDLPDDRQDRAGHVDEHIAGVDRVQITPVGRVGAPRPGQGPQRDHAEQPADQGHHEHGAA